MDIDYQLIDKFFEGNTTAEETVLVLTAISSNPDLEEYFITRKRLEYANEQTEDYSSFIPASSMAADDGRNLCDLQCEAFILQKAGIGIPKEDLARESKKNYWLRTQGTPLFNMGKLLESKGFIASRVYNASIEVLKQKLKRHSIIVVVNGDTLENNNQDILSDDFSLDDNPNHAVVVLAIDDALGLVSIYNPAKVDEVSQYDLSIFKEAWEESRNYMVAVRKRKKNEYIPQPIDTSDVNINPDLFLAFIQQRQVLLQGIRSTKVEAIAEEHHIVRSPVRLFTIFVYQCRDGLVAHILVSQIEVVATLVSGIVCQCHGLHLGIHPIAVTYLPRFEHRFSSELL